MATQVKRRRGTVVEHSSFTGAEAEITVVTDDWSLRVHDGTTVGGHPISGGSGSGDVSGPTSSVDNHVVQFNGITGKLIEDSGFTIASSVPLNAVFTDTTYSVGDGGLTEINFTQVKSDKLGTIAENAEVNNISDIDALTLTDGSNADALHIHSGLGDVVGPLSSIDNNFPTFDGTTGKLIKDSGAQLNDTGSGISDIWSANKITAAIGSSGDVSGPASSVDTHVASFNGSTGKIIEDSGFTIETSVPQNALFTDTVPTVQTFDNTDLVGNVLTIAHGLGRLPATMTLYDENGNESGAMKSANTTNVIIDFGGAITGTWSIVII